MKYIFICGTVVSGVGKGTFACNLATLLRNSGFTITMAKIDPYFNYNASLLGPTEHGEVFVLKDGAECDLDLGNYERAIPISLTEEHNLTSGKTFGDVIGDERRGLYLGKTVQLIPHVEEKVRKWFETVSKIKVDYEYPNKENDICIVEIGGTVGDFESLIYFEAIRVIMANLPPEDTCLVTITYLPNIDKQSKTKPAQHGIRDLTSVGLFPDFLICRCEKEPDPDAVAKLEYYTNLKDRCFVLPNTEPFNIINVMYLKKIHIAVLNKLKLPYRGCNNKNFLKLNLLHRQLNCGSQNIKTIRVGFLYKYDRFHESYHSVLKAIEHAALMANTKFELVHIKAIDTLPLRCSFWDQINDKEEKEKLQAKLYEEISSCDGVIVPGGI